VAVARYLCEVIDRAMFGELAVFKETPGYFGYRPADRRTVSNSFLHGMAASIATKLRTMKADRDAAHRASGRDLVVVKSAIVDEELTKLGMSFTTRRASRRTVAKDAFATGHAAGKKLAINPAIVQKPGATPVGKNGA
jgi:hypothetical protein